LDGGSGYKSVKLSPEIYANARTDLADILILDGAGSPIPYFILNLTSTDERSETVYPMALADSFIKDSDRYYDYSVTSVPENQDILATSIKISARGEFVKNISVSGSYDGIHWEGAVNYTIFNVDGSSRLEIPLSPALKYTWYRFRIPFADDPIAIDGMELAYSPSVRRLTEFTEGLSPAFSTQTDGKETVVTLNGVKNLPLADISIHTGSTFKRRVTAGYTDKTLFNLSFNDTAYQDLTLPMNGYAPAADSLAITIYNNDDAPIQIDGADVEYRAARLVFKAPAEGQAYVYYGDPSIMSPPRYDIANYTDLVLNQGVDVLALGEPEIIQAAPEEPPPAVTDYRLYYNILIGVIAAVLAAVIVLRLRKADGRP